MPTEHSRTSGDSTIWSTDVVRRYAAVASSVDIPQVVVVVGLPGSDVAVVTELVRRWLADRGGAVLVDTAELMYVEAAFVGKTQLRSPIDDSLLNRVDRHIVDLTAEAVRKQANLVFVVSQALAAVDEFPPVPRGYQIRTVVVAGSPESCLTAASEEADVLRSVFGLDVAVPNDESEVEALAGELASRLTTWSTLRCDQKMDVHVADIFASTVAKKSIPMEASVLASLLMGEPQEAVPRTKPKPRSNSVSRAGRPRKVRLANFEPSDSVAPEKDSVPKAKSRQTDATNRSRRPDSELPDEPRNADNVSSGFKKSAEPPRVVEPSPTQPRDIQPRPAESQHRQRPRHESRPIQTSFSNDDEGVELVTPQELNMEGLSPARIKTLMKRVDMQLAVLNSADSGT